MIDLSIRFRHINHNRDIALFNLSRELERRVGGRKDGITDLEYVMTVAKECPWLKRETRENIFGAYQKAIGNLSEKADKEILKYVTGNLLVEDTATGTTIMCRDGRVIISREGTEKDWSSLSPEEKMKFYNIFSELIY